MWRQGQFCWKPLLFSAREWMGTWTVSSLDTNNTAPVFFSSVPLTPLSYRLKTQYNWFSQPLRWCRFVCIYCNKCFFSIAIATGRPSHGLRREGQMLYECHVKTEQKSQEMCNLNVKTGVHRWAERGNKEIQKTVLIRAMVVYLITGSPIYLECTSTIITFLKHFI